LKQLEVRSSREYVSSYDLALLHLALGDARLDEVRSHRRFHALVRGLNLTRGV
jgi:hypothetical protein